MSEESVNEVQRKQTTLSPRELVMKYTHYFPWVVISVAVMLLLAWVKLRYSIPIYQVTGKLLVTNQMPYGGGGDKFDDIFMGQNNFKINDEIEVIRSRSMAGRVIRALGLQQQYINKGKIRSSTIHPRDMPFLFEITKITDSARGFSLLMKLTSDNGFQLNEQPRKYLFGQEVELPEVHFKIIDIGRQWKHFGSDEFMVTWHSVESLAGALAGSIAAAPANDFTNVLAITYKTENTRLGRDIVNQYMSEYQQSRLEDKREIAVNTLQFINEQLDTVVRSLGGVERNLQNYREKNKIVNTEQQSELFFSELSETSKEITALEVKIKVADFLLNYISDRTKTTTIEPSMLGIEEPSLLQQVTAFNELQLNLESTLKTTPRGNPAVRDLETRIDRLRDGMIQNVKNIRETYRLAINDLTSKSTKIDKAISSIPSKDKQLLEVTRQQNILQELYSFLLQKKLEMSISSASTISNIKVVESAVSSNSPVSPNRKALYVIAVLLGIAIPSGIIFLIEYLNDKVKSRYEIEQLTDAPIIGEVGHAEEAHTLVVTRNNRRFLAEQFRIIRSNLQFILPRTEKPVLLVTSSFSGEGKSFVSTNLGSVMALSGKRTVILEFDIRKPKILKGLGLNQRKGITNYLVGNLPLAQIVHPVPEVENLFVIPCGPVPPNPSEMLLSTRVAEMFEEIKEQFDAVIIDSAPVGLVSDGITLGKFANAAIYIIRHDYTLKKQIRMIDDLYHEQKLPRLSIIINDILTRGSYGNYYAYGNYYGYNSYGYGSDYFDKELPTKSRFNWAFGKKKKKA
jgi:capsular exopolysaccharide synthesis family protein